MSDEPAKKSLDLDTAQRLYIAAGRPDQAEAAGFVIDAVRNTVQGEWGKSFVNSLEGIMVRHIGPLKDSVDGLRTEVATRLGKIEEEVDGLHKGQSRISAEIKEVDARHGGQWEELSTSHRELALRLDRKRAELDQIQQELEAFKRFKADIEARIQRALPEEETQQLIALLRQIAAERGGSDAG